MNGELCPICGETMVLRPPGVSKKTGKPYDAFMSCPNYAKHPAKVQGSFGGSQSNTGNEEVLSALRKVYAKLEEINALVVDNNLLLVDITRKEDDRG